MPAPITSITHHLPFGGSPEHTAPGCSRRGFLDRLRVLGGVAMLPDLVESSLSGPAAAVYDVLDFGAVGDGVTNDAPAIQQAIDRCTAAGGGIVSLPAGRTFLSGTLQLKDNVHLLVGSGAEIIASTEPGHYRDGTLILANDARNVTIGGRGTINARGRLFMQEELPNIYRAKPWRPRMMVLENCRNVRMEGLTLRESALWTVHLAGCDDVAIHGVSILNDRKIPNCDGIAVDSSRNVRISDCHIEAGDDCVVLKTLRQFARYGPCENVTVRGCTLASTSAALKIGTETVNDIRHVVFSDCVIRDSSRGLAIMLRDEGTVEDVLFSNMTVETRYPDPAWWGAAEPIHLSAIARVADRPVGQVRHVRFSNIQCRSENGAQLYGTPRSVPRDITLQDVSIRLEKWTDMAGGKRDLRPSDSTGVGNHPTSGIQAERITDLALHRCRVEWGGDRPSYFRHALELHDVQGLDLQHFRGDSAQPGLPPALIG